MGDKTAYGPVVTANYAIFTFLQVRPFYSTKAGYGFKTVYASFDRVSFDQAWSFGKELEYVKGSTERQPCFQAPCMVTTNGIVTLSEEDFLAAATKGYEFELVGKSGKVTGKAAALAFREALKLKSKLGPTIAAPTINAAPADLGAQDSSRKFDEIL
ncbi:hypothetical protein LJR231_002480 [Phyllobacterium sp. LjRoot231]|uniref:hypothetical protein n=1 Tax=Phyllobacterium sp. LjRoot231 TaxID=3342289 RepID=UPI003ECF9945